MRLSHELRITWQQRRLGRKEISVAASRRELSRRGAVQNSTERLLPGRVTPRHKLLQAPTSSYMLLHAARLRRSMQFRFLSTFFSHNLATAVFPVVIFTARTYTRTLPPHLLPWRSSGPRRQRTH